METRIDREAVELLAPCGCEVCSTLLALLERVEKLEGAIGEAVKSLEFALDHEPIACTFMGCSTTNASEALAALRAGTEEKA